MNIIVNASALRSSGALSIYKQFISHLRNNINGNKYYIFVDSSVPQPQIDGVVYIHDNDHSWIHRIWWDIIGINKKKKKNNIESYKFISLQNTGIVTNKEQIIYYHQSLPFYKYKWDLFKSSERLLWLYKNIYPFFIRLTLTKKTQIIVQIPFIKKGFKEKFSFDEKRIHVLFPDTEKINIKDIHDLDINHEYFHLIYPATPHIYKCHETLFKALKIIKRENHQIYNKIRLHITIYKGQSLYIDKLTTKYNVEDVVIYEGIKPHTELLSLYKSSDCLVFPSILETLGLPLLEGATFGLPIIASNLEYSKEVLGSYEGAIFVDSKDENSWATEILKIFINKKKFKPSNNNRESSWNKFFNLLENNK